MSGRGYWQRLKPMEKLARMLLNHVEGILNYCRTKVPMGVVEAVNGNIKALLRRGRGYRDLDTFWWRRQAWPPPKPHSLLSRKALKMHHFNSCWSSPVF